MLYSRILLAGTLSLAACGGSSPAPKGPSDSQTASSSSGTSPDGAPSNGASSNGGSSDSKSNEFQIGKSDTAGSAHGVSPSKIKATKTHAAMKFFVIDKNKDAPMTGIVISLQSKDGQKFYTEETDDLGYGEVLVPAGKSYELVYLTLGEKNINAKVTVTDDPYQNIKLTLRYKPWVDKKIAVAMPPETAEAAPVEPAAPAFRLDGVTFASGSSELNPESHPRLDSVVEYLTHKKSARIEVSGHTDNVGSRAKNKKLSQKRADACREYLIGKGIEASRIEAVGYGDEQPVANNKDDEGRKQNRRIEAKEL